MKKGIYFLISALLALTDMLLKEIFERGGKVRIIKNTGFAGSFMHKRPKLVMLVSTIFTGFIAVYIALSGENGRITTIKKIGWSTVLGGALSNSIDRIRKHYVVDYIPIGKYVYNISDFFIYIGALTAGIAELFNP